MPKFEYRAIKVKQTKDGPETVLFAASAVDIHQWAGIPHKRTVDGTDSAGFQRSYDNKRNEDLLSFFRDTNNTLQNPLMCATNGYGEGYVKFEADPSLNLDESNKTGTLIVDDSYLEKLTLLGLFGVVKDRLEIRLPHLKGQKASPSKIAELKESLIDDTGHEEDPLEEDSVDEDDSSEETAYPGNDSAVPQDAIADITRETMVEAFWEEIAARHEVLQELESKQLSDPATRTEFAKYDKEVLLGYARPVVLVDGQHRLLGAVKAAKDVFKTNPSIVAGELQKLSNLSNADAEREIMKQHARHLPVSLLLSDNPAEHVFQFVVVNQKATPVAKALLGTIISTTLSEDELNQVTDRLVAANIPLDDSRAVTYMATTPTSPFYRLVNRGIKTDGVPENTNNLLDWSVLLQLIDIFRKLKGGKLIDGTDKPLDWSKIWAEQHLKGSAIVGGASSVKDALDTWSALDGPWREVFIKFFSVIRDRFGGKEEVNPLNAWCNPRMSQLFNKPSLLILSADFFRHLRTFKVQLNSANDIEKHMDAWLEKVNPKYFSIKWGGKNGLEGVKKDAPATRKAWTKIWINHLADPSKSLRAIEFRSINT